MSKSSDDPVPLQSEKREKWIREVKEERLQKIAEGTSSALRLGNSSAASFPGKNECSETHCNMIIKKERKKQFLPYLPQRSW